MSIPVPVSVTVLALLVVGLFWVMVRGWRARTARTADLVPALPDVPASLGTARTAPVDVLYVTTTVARSWLERVTAHGLGTRASARAQVFDTGVLVSRQGHRELFLPADALRDVVRSSGMVGKFVGDESIVVVTWQPGTDRAALVDTGLRPVHENDRDLLQSAVVALISPTPPSDPDSIIEPKEQK